MKANFSMRTFVVLVSRLFLVLSVAMSMSFVSSITMSFAQEVPVLKYYYVCDIATPEALKEVQDAVNEILVKTIGAKVELHPLSFHEVTTKIPLILASGEDADIVSASSFCPYITEYQTKGLLALDELLPKVTPKLWNKYDKKVWNGVRIQGKIYMVPNNNPGVSYPGFWARKDLVDKYKFDWENADSWEAWEPFFDAILKNEKDVIPILSTQDYWGRLWFPNYYGYDSVGSVKAPYGQSLIVVKATDPKRKVIAAPFTKEYEHAVRLARKWYLKGYFSKTPPTEAEMMTMRANGKFATFAVPFVGEGDTTAMANNEWGGRTILQAKIKGKNPIITTGTYTGSGNAVCRVSKHPDLALKFIEQMHTNEALHNLLNFGIEGKHWVWVDKGRKLISLPPGVTGRTAQYNPNTYWQFGDKNLQYFMSEGDLHTAERVAKAMKNAIYSTILGFTPDPTPVKSQIAAVSSVAQEYGEPLEKGLVDPDDPNRGLTVFRNKLREAGINRIVVEFQRQINKWALQNIKE
ncbi:MAG TPA: ABC transporter substrate-binding protein [bacterium]|nr:ABC transporter substrate-binding protein [bacterium]